ncbi:MAG TPA: TlpA disulfide reductase family protein, partial [Chitinophagaceae bacterium]|nr:TlpA disulfide reductase family protein [Chitinophagaceae bacterium]
MKKIILFIVLLTGSAIAFSQKSFHLTIVLDSSINSKNITCRYYNGESDIIVKDSFVNNSLVLSDKFYSLYSSFHIEYRTDNSAYYTNDFFINEKPATISFRFRPDDPEGVLRYSKRVNAIPVYDTNTNALFKQLVAYRIKEARAVSDFWQKHGGEAYGNDSLMQLNRELFKSLNKRSISFFKKYPQNYFSFWYFRAEVVETSVTFLTKDIPYLKYLVASIKSVYPKKYTESPEGQRIINKLSVLVNPPRVNTRAPLFIARDINGKNTRLSDYKGKYVLLDFWASWCLPCMREIPFIKQLSNEYPS